MADKRTLTFTDKKKLEEQLEALNIEKKKVAEEIQIARGFGDLSENAEYDAAKDRERDVYRQIAELEEELRTATFVDDSNAGSTHCALGTVVRVLDMEFDEEDEYTLVGYTEADPAKLFISNESPIGIALTDTDGRGTGAQVGDIVTAHTPGGEIQLKELEIRQR